MKREFNDLTLFLISNFHGTKRKFIFGIGSHFKSFTRKRVAQSLCTALNALGKKLQQKVLNLKQTFAKDKEFFLRWRWVEDLRNAVSICFSLRLRAQQEIRSCDAGNEKILLFLLLARSSVKLKTRNLRKVFRRFDFFFSLLTFQCFSDYSKSELPALNFFPCSLRSKLILIVLIFLPFVYLRRRRYDKARNSIMIKASPSPSNKSRNWKTFGPFADSNFPFEAHKKSVSSSSVRLRGTWYQW